MGMLTTKEPGPHKYDWRSFDMIPRDTTEWVGYTNGDMGYPPFNPPVGTISREPATGVILSALYFDPETDRHVAIFTGDLYEQNMYIGLNIDGQSARVKGAQRIGSTTYFFFPGIEVQFQAGETYTVTFTDSRQ